MKTTSKKGFYIGDICYALSREQYDDMWGSKGYNDGEYETDGHTWAVYGTAYGDGTYMSSDYKYTFSVDAGVIGVIPLELIKEEKFEDASDLGLVVTGHLSIDFSCTDGFYEISIENMENNTKEYFEIDTTDDTEALFI